MAIVVQQYSGRLLRAARRRARMSVTELAYHAGRSCDLVSSIEQGRVRLVPPTAAAFARALGIDPAALLEQVTYPSRAHVPNVVRAGLALARDPSRGDHEIAAEYGLPWQSVTAARRSLLGQDHPRTGQA